MSIEEIKEFYNFTFSDDSVQRDLINTRTVDEFVDLALKLGSDRGYYFTKDEFISTMDGFGFNRSFSEICFDNKWIEKIMQVGWVPLGYTRN